MDEREMCLVGTICGLPTRHVSKNRSSDFMLLSKMAQMNTLNQRMFAYIKQVNYAILTLINEAFCDCNVDDPYIVGLCLL